VAVSNSSLQFVAHRPPFSLSYALRTCNTLRRSDSPTFCGLSADEQISDLDPRSDSSGAATCPGGGYTQEMRPQVQTPLTGLMTSDPYPRKSRSRTATCSREETLERCAHEPRAVFVPFPRFLTLEPPADRT
jgi:hypothetical protein